MDVAGTSGHMWQAALESKEIARWRHQLIVVARMDTTLEEEAVKNI